MTTAANLLVAQGFVPCFARVCRTCNGAGAISAPFNGSVSSFGGAGGYLTQQSSAQCGPCSCKNGLEYAAVDPKDFVEWVFTQAFSRIELEPAIRDAFMLAVVRATESKMIDPK